MNNSLRKAFSHHIGVVGQRMDDVAVLMRIEEGQRQPPQLRKCIPHDSVGRAEGDELPGARAQPLKERANDIQPRNQNQQGYESILPAFAAVCEQIDRIADIARRQQQTDVADEHGGKDKKERFFTFAHINQQARYSIVLHYAAPPLIC